MSAVVACQCGRPLRPRPCRHTASRWVAYVSVILAACVLWTVKTALVLGLGVLAVFS